MKKLIICLFFVIGFMVGNAQDSKVVSAYNYLKPQYNQLDKAMEAINQASAHEKTMMKPKTWYYRGLVYTAIATTTDENYKNLCPDPLTEALNSYMKSLKLDVKNSYRNEVIMRLPQLQVLLINKGIEDFNNNAYEKAVNRFESSLRIDSIPEISKTDSMVIFNVGVACEKAKIFDKALKYYQLAASMKYEGPKVYLFMANIHKELKDTVTAMNIIREGISNFPNDNSILMVDLINYYLTSNKIGDALSYLKIAIEKDPGNYSYYFAQGTLYDKLNQFDSAKTSYEKAISLQPDYFDAYYNLGALYYNIAVNLYKEANDIPPKEQARYDATLAKAKEQLALAKPYLEKAHELVPTDKSTLYSLKEIYYRLQMVDKSAEIKQKLENLK